MPDSSAPITRRRALVLGDTSASAHHGCEMVMTNLIHGLSRIGVDVIAQHSGKGWAQDSRIVSAMESVDLLVINGEGTMHHDRPQGYEFVDAAEHIHRRGKPSYLVNCTWQANSETLAKRAAVFRRIHVRESNSAEELGRSGIQSSITPDLTFATDWGNPEGARRGWVVTDSTITSITRQLFRLSQSLGATTYLPVIASDDSLMSHDRRYKRRLQRGWGKLLWSTAGMVTSYISLSHAVPNAREFLQRISQCQGMLTGRFHAVCFAILTGTPFLAVRSNSTKIESLLRDVGLSDQRVIELGIGTEAIRNRLNSCQYSLVEEQSRQSFVARARQQIRQMFDSIRDDFEA